MNLAELRKTYQSGQLRRSDLDPDALAQFGKWFKDALACEAVSEANAMTLATADASGRPLARTVLLKGFDARGLVFFTNLGSRKAQHIAANPQVALHFLWLPLERQVCLTGRAQVVSREETAAYFATRPLASRLGAWASEQSRVVASRSVLEAAYEEKRRQFAEGEIPVPETWGGYRVVPDSVEFWQGRASRLHDRFLYTREDKGSWRIERLAP